MRSVPSWDTSANSFSIRIPPKPFAALKELGGEHKEHPPRMQ